MDKHQKDMKGDHKTAVNKEGIVKNMKDGHITDHKTDNKPNSAPKNADKKAPGTQSK